MQSARGVTDAAASLPVLYRDEHFIAIDKPSGLQVHRSGILDASAFAGLFDRFESERSGRCAGSALQ